MGSLSLKRHYLVCWYRPANSSSVSLVSLNCFLGILFARRRQMNLSAAADDDS